jgi:hypothetical protein
MVKHVDYPLYIQRITGVCIHLARELSSMTLQTLCQRRIDQDDARRCDPDMVRDRICTRCLRRVPNRPRLVKGPR